jgi:hypothetical protein
MYMSRKWTPGRLAWLALLLLGVGGAAGLIPSPAYAGDWMQISCVNPSGSSAPSEGWTSVVSGDPGYGSDNSTSCASGSPMYGILSTDAAAPVDAGENLQYTPPGGSMLVGGSVDVNLFADGYGYNASGTAVLYTPSLSYDGGDVFFQCAYGLAACSSGSDPHDFSGVLALPVNRGGNFYLGAGCGGDAGESCNEGGSNGAWALVQLQWAHFLLFNGSSPTASAFGGSLLSPDAYGTADVSFTASDPSGPGVYNVTVKLGGNTVYDATPDTESGHCAPVGTDSASGALMFDYQQPCPTSEFVDVPIDTAELPDGEQQLTVAVTDAAQNTSTVLDQTITTRQAGTGTVSTPAPPARARRIKAKLLISWRYSGNTTRLLGIKARGLPHDAKISIRCTGHGCPRHSARTAKATRVKRLWSALAGEVLGAGDREVFTITAPGRSPERIEVLIRDDKGPLAKVL